MAFLHVLALAAVCQVAWAAGPGSPAPPRSGSGSGRLEEAPAWLRRHEREAARERGRDSHAIYFPMTHRSILEPDFRPSKPRGRFLLSNSSSSSSSPEISWQLTKLTNPVSYFTTISLGSARQPFNVLVDTGSSLLWVQCDCIQCDQDPNSTLPMNPSYSSEISSTENAVLCADPSCTDLSNFFRSSYGCNIPTPNTTVDFSPTDLYCEYVVKYLDTSFTWGNVYLDTLAVTLSNNTSLQPDVLFGCGRVQSNNISPGTYGYDGLMGLAMGPDSILNYLNGIGDSFSVCLEGVGTDGHLVIGRTTLPTDAVYSPVYVAPGSRMYFWQLDLLGFFIGSDDANTYEAPSNPYVLDTGSSISILSKTFYYTLYSAVLNITETSDTAVAFGHWTAQDLADNFPTLTLLFPSSEDASQAVAMEIPAFNYLSTQLREDEQGKYTLIYPAALAFDGDGQSIIGGSWLQNFEILHQTIDESNARIGWYLINCTTGKVLYPNGTNGEVVVKFPETTSDVPPAAKSPPSPPSRPPPASTNSVDTSPAPPLATPSATPLPPPASQNTSSRAKPPPSISVTSPPLSPAGQNISSAVHNHITIPVLLLFLTAFYIV